MTAEWINSGGLADGAVASRTRSAMLLACGSVISLCAAPSLAEVVAPQRAPEFVAGTADLQTLEIGTAKFDPNSAFVYPLLKPEVVVAKDGFGASEGMTKDEVDALRPLNPWAGLNRCAALPCTQPTTVRIFLAGAHGQDDDDPASDDAHPEVLIIGNLPVDTVVRAFVAGTAQNPVRGAGDGRTLTAADLQQGLFDFGIAGGDGALSRATCLGLDASGDLGLAPGQSVVGYEVTLPAGSPANLRVIPVTDGGLLAAYGLDKDSDDLRKLLVGNAGDALKGGSQTSLPLPDSVIDSFTDAPGINPTDGQAAPTYTFITNPDPPDNGEEYPTDPDDPTGGNPSDPTDPDDPEGGDPGDGDPGDGDPDDPNGGDGDPDDPNGGKPPLSGRPDDPMIVIRPQLDPFAENQIPNEADETAPLIPAPGALVVLSVGGALFGGGRRRR